MASEPLSSPFICVRCLGVEQRLVLTDRDLARLNASFSFFLLVSRFCLIEQLLSFALLRVDNDHRSTCPNDVQCENDLSSTKGDRERYERRTTSERKALSNERVQPHAIETVIE